jgi:hypothetical protein
VDIPRIALDPAAGPARAASPALKAWQVGQILQLTVLEVTAPGRAVLMMAGQRFEAQTDATLAPGQRLTVRVESGQAPQVLRVLPPPDEAAQASATLRQALATLLPGAGSLREAVESLATLARAPQPPSITPGPPLPPAATTAARTLLSTLPTPAQVSTGAGLRAAVENSGTFLEARLAASTPGQPAPRADLKAQLLLLANLLPRATGRPEALAAPPPPGAATGEPRATVPGPPPTAGPPTLSPPAGGPASPPPVPATRPEGRPAAGPEGAAGTPPPTSVVPDAARAGAETEAALARIELNQLRAVPRGEGAPPGWLVEVPVRSGDRQDLLTLRVEPDPRTDPDGHPRGWSVSLSLDLPELGPIQARVGWQARTVTATLWAERPETLERLGRHSGELADALRAAGLEPAAIRCLPGPGPGPRPLPLPDGLLDLRA